MDLILEQYELKFKKSSENCLVAEIHHWNKNTYGVANIIPIGHLILTSEQECETFLPHQSIQLFLRTDVRYNMETKETTVVSNPKGQAGPNKTLLKKLMKIKDSKLPFYHPELPKYIINYILSKKICEEPIGMNIYHYTCAGYREQGQLWRDDD